MFKKLAVASIAAFALVAPQPASADAALDAPLCENGSVFPVAVGVRCYAGRMCTVYVRVDLEIVDGSRQRYCI